MFGIKDVVIKSQMSSYAAKYAAPGNEAKVERMLDNAYEDYKEGFMTPAKAEKLAAELIELARPDKRAELKQMLAQNKGKFAQYLGG
jgi:hypothetical protein